MSIAPSLTPVPAEARAAVDGSPKPRVLCVDDEPMVLDSLRDTLRRRFEVVITTNGFEALRLLTERPCHVVLSDMRMPRIDGARLLTLARKHAPDTVRLVLTGQSTLDDAVAAVNDGEIFRFLVKPCVTRDLVAALDSAVARHEALVRERELGEQMLAGTTQTLMQMAAAVDPEVPARAARIHRQATELAAAADVAAPAEELERACRLLQAGVVGLSPETRAALSHGSRLGRHQAAELERLPELAAGFLTSIPPLTPAAALLSAAAGPPATPGEPETPAAARVLRIVLDFELLEAQGMSAMTALQRLRARADRYDESLLETFASLQRIA